MEDLPSTKNQSTGCEATREAYEAQAAECLRVGVLQQRLLLSLAIKLAGDTEEGFDLYQQSLLDCHDAIQRKGFTGSNYKFYLYQSIKWGHVERQRAAGKLCAFEDDEQYDQPLTTAPQVDNLAALAADIERELESTFAPADVAAFRLHVAGKTFREIQDLTGKEFSWIRRRIVKMKKVLRETFAPAWAHLDLTE